MLLSKQKNTLPLQEHELADDIVLQVSGLSVHFEFKRSVVKAIRDVSFSLRKGKTLAIVGESGSGKSVTSLSLMGLLAEPGKIAKGSAFYRQSNGQTMDLATLNERQMRQVRGQEIAMIFQEPMTSLNPLIKVGDQIAEMVRLHEPVSKAEARIRAKNMLELVEIPSAEQRLNDYPHQMSGGMRQRVMIALALVCKPSLLIADEPTTALDVTIQAQILDLMRKLQAEMNMSILFITHDMGVVAETADDVAVMYAGEIIEQAGVKEIFKNPLHPYTRGLLNSIPNAERDTDEHGNRTRLNPIKGNVPSFADMPQGCTFASRCPFAEDKCQQVVELSQIQTNHLARCWKAEEFL